MHAVEKDGRGLGRARALGKSSEAEDARRDRRKGRRKARSDWSAESAHADSRSRLSSYFN